jgi:predicted dinucleotide-binding enzyme
VAPIAAALAASEVLVVAIPGDAVDGFVAENAAALDGKLVIDASNRMGAPVMNSAATYREAAHSARYARGFNSVGVECLIDPLFDGAPIDLFYSSPASDQGTVHELMACSGLRPVCVGDDPNVVDGVCRLWIALVFGQGHGRELGFRTFER